MKFNFVVENLMNKTFLMVVFVLFFTRIGFVEAADEKNAQLRATLQIAMAQHVITKIEKTDMAGIYAVQLGGANWVYASDDGKYIFSGKMFAVESDGLVDLTEQKLGKIRQELLAAVPGKDMVIFSPKGKVKGVVYAFTDVDCTYCKRFHEEVPKLTELGVEVRYLAWPRSGLGEKSVTYSKMRSVWCAEGRGEAMTKAKAGKVLPPAEESCETPIPSQYKLGAELGVRGTPALYLEDGSQVGGYRKAEDLARSMGLL
jgi:thiol:disulfide interchange protein DsbC